jgi:hypothetical protein
VFVLGVLSHDRSQVQPQEETQERFQTIKMTMFTGLGDRKLPCHAGPYGRDTRWSRGRRQGEG